MTHSLRALFALFLSAALLIGGNGLQNTLLSVRGEIEGFPLTLIGFLMSAYYVGFVTGCRYGPYLIQRVGHVRTFTALASLASAAALVHVLFVNPVVWLALRVITGFALAGMYMVIEAWINESVDNSSRGKVLSLYRIIDLTALTIGQALLTAAAPESFNLFAIVSIIISLSLVPVALSTAPKPQEVKQVKMDFKKVMRLSPVAILGCLGIGLGNGAFWAMAPVYIQTGGFGTDVIAGFISATIIAGALIQWPVGWLSDKVDRRIVLLICTSLGTVVTATMAFRAPETPTALMQYSFLFGLCAMPVFGLSIAHGNDRAKAGEHISLNATLLFAYGFGAILGPLLGAFAMDISRPYLFAYISVVFGGLTVITLSRIILRDASENRRAYVPVPRSTPAVLQLMPKRKPKKD